MDYKPFIMKHREVGADITVSAVPMDEERAEAFGLMKIDGTGRIIDFAEKPKGDALKAMAVDTTILGLDAEKSERNAVHRLHGYLRLLRQGYGRFVDETLQRTKRLWR